MKKMNVLFVDDEINVLNSIRRITIDEDYESIVALSGEKALEVFKDNEIAVIVTDMKMPHMSGLELLEMVKKISPDTMRIVLSGYAQMPQILATVNKVGVLKYITKPWNNDEEFIPAIREALNYYKLKKENEVFKSELEEKNRLYKKMLDYNNSLIKNSHSDTQNIKKMTQNIFSLRRNFFESLKSGKITMESFKYYNDMIEKVYFQYLDVIPSVRETFSIKTFNERINALKIGKVEVVIDKIETEAFNCTGDLKLALFILNILFSEVVKKFNKEEAIIVISTNDKLIVNLICKDKEFIEKINKDIEFKIIYRILNEICTTFNGGINVNTNKSFISFNTNIEIRR